MKTGLLYVRTVDAVSIREDESNVSEVMEGIVMKKKAEASCSTETKENWMT